jgi:hypothetical protein
MQHYQVQINKAFHIFMMLVSPLFGGYLIFKMKKKAHIIFFGTMFFGLLGSLFIYNDSADGATHLLAVKRFYLDMSFFEFIEGVSKLLTFQPIEGSQDLYKHIISYLAGAVFQIPELIHVFGGLLLGYFFTKSVLLVFEDKSKQKMGVLLLSFAALFLIVRSVSALNSLRMWTGMWVFFYGSYSYIKNKKVKFLWYVGLAVFVHFSYLLFSIPLIAAILLRNQKKLVVGIFIVSFFINTGFEQVFNIVESTGLYQGKMKGNIIDDQEVDRRAAQYEGKNISQNIYRDFGPLIYNTFSIPLLSFILIIVYLRKSKIEHLNFLIAGGLLLVSLSNLVNGISPSIYGRGLTIAGTFLTAAAIQVLILNKYEMYTRFKSDLIKFSLSIFLLSAVLHVLFHLSYAFNTISGFVITFPIASWYLGSDDLSIKDFIVVFF